MLEIGENQRALSNPSRVALAEIESRSGRLRFGLAAGATYGAGPNVGTEDVGRTVAASVGGQWRVARLWHTSTGIGWRAWNGDPATVTPTEGHADLASFSGQTLGAWMETEGSDFHTFVTHSPAIDQLEIYRQVNNGAWALHHAAVTLPAPVNAGAGGYTAFAIVDRQTCFLLHTPSGGKQARIWHGTFATAPFNGAVTWQELPYRISAGHAEDRFKPDPDLGEALDRRAANSFDAARFKGNTVLLCQNHAIGRSQILVQSEVGVWADPMPVIPMDLVDADNHLLLSRLFVLGDTLYATGTLARNGVAYNCLLRSQDGTTWFLGSDALLAPTLSATHHGQLVLANSRLHYLAGGWTRSLATPLATGAKVSPYAVAIERGARSVPTAEIEIPADGTGPTEDDAVLVRLGYDARSNLVQVGAFGLDRVSEAHSWEGARRTLHLRDLHGKQLHDWATPYTFDLWGQSKVVAEMETEDEYTVTVGDPRPSFKTVRLVESFDTSDTTIVLEARDGKAPLTVGEMLRHRDGILATRLRVTAQPTGDGPYTYPIAVEQGDIATFAAGAELSCDELFLGQLGAEDRVALELPRRFVGQFGTVILRFSEHDHRYGESASLLLHRADDDNGYRLRLTKTETSGTTALLWHFERLVEGTATLVASGTLMDGATPLNAINRTLHVRWRVQNGRVTLWAAPSTLYSSPLVDYTEETVLPAAEGGLGFGGVATPITHALSEEWSEQSPASVPGNRLILDAPATAFPASGALVVNGTRVPYSARTLQTRLPAGPLSPMTDIALTNFQFAHRYENGLWYMAGVLPFDVTGMVVRVRARKTMLTPTEPESVADEWTTVTGCQLSYDDNGTTRTRLQLPLFPEGSRTQIWWGYEQPDTFDESGWLVGMRFYPNFVLETGSWPAIASTQPVMLDVRDEQAPLGTALDRVELCDLEPDLSLSESVRKVARLAGVEVAADTLAESRWGFTNGAGWTVTYANGLPRLEGTSGTHFGTFALVDGVFQAKLRLGQAGLALGRGGGGLAIRFTSNAIELRDLVSDTLRASVPYAQGAAANQLVTARISIEGACLSLWLDDAFAAFFVDARLTNTVKTLGVIAYELTVIEYLEVMEAYERLGRFLFHQGTTPMEAIAQMVGGRRLGLLFRASRPPRFGTLEQREQAGALLGTLLVTNEERDDAAICTLAQVRGAHHLAEAALNAHLYGLRFLIAENPDLLTADSCAREAWNLLRQTQEQARAATVEMRADLRIENEDQCTALIGDAESDWIVDSSSLTFLVAPDDAALDMRLGLRRALE